jgi:hypothetical protein
MNISLSVISDFMLVATLPLMGILGFWEHNLSISETNHELVQIVLVFIIFGWIFLWYSLGEQDRLYQIRSQENKETTYFFQSITMSESNTQSNSYKIDDVPALFDKFPNERVESFHVKNN